MRPTHPTRAASRFHTRDAADLDDHGTRTPHPRPTPGPLLPTHLSAPFGSVELSSAIVRDLRAGRLPFEAFQVDETGEALPSEDAPSEAAREIMSHMTRFEALERPTAADVLRHDWLRAEHAPQLPACAADDVSAGDEVKHVAPVGEPSQPTSCQEPGARSREWRDDGTAAIIDRLAMLGVGG